MTARPVFAIGGYRGPDPTRDLRASDAGGPYTITWGCGRTDRVLTLDEARAWIHARHVGAEVGHVGDLEDGGPETVAWDGTPAARIIAVIRPEDRP